MNEDALATLISRALDCTSALTEQAQRGDAAVDQTRARIDEVIHSLSVSAQESHRVLSVLDADLRALEATLARERVDVAQAFEAATNYAQQSGIEASTTLLRLEAAFTSLERQHDDACHNLEAEVARLEQHWQSLVEITHREVAVAATAHEDAVADLAGSSACVLEQIDTLESAREQLLTAYVEREALLDAGLARLEATMSELASRTLAVITRIEVRVERASDASTSAVHRAFAVDAVDALGALSSSLCQALTDLEGVGRQPRAVAENELAVLTQKLRSCLPALEQIIAIHRKARQLEICIEESPNLS